MELRTLLDWVVAYKLRSVPGVIEVNGMGGEAKQYQVVLDPKRLAGYRDLRAELAGRALSGLTTDDQQALAAAVPALHRLAGQLEAR